MRQLKDVPPFERGLPWTQWLVAKERDGASPLDRIIARGKAAAAKPKERRTQEPRPAFGDRRAA